MPAASSFGRVAEQILRAHVRDSRHPFAIAVRRRGGTFWEPRRGPSPCPPIPDAAGNCVGASIAVAERYGLDVAIGFGLPEGDTEPRAHVWALDSQGVVDPAWEAVGAAAGYLGFIPSRLEIAALRIANIDQVVRAR